MISPERFDGAAVWQTLSLEARDAIGAAALEIVAGRFCIETVDDGGPWRTPENRAAYAAEHAANEKLDNVFVDFVDRDRLVDGEDNPKLPSIIGMVCLECGCSQDDACAEGCAWAKPDLCTACDRKEVA